MKPFLKWVGGKAQLLPTLMQHVPKDYTTYIEPFVGGGALFFHLAELYPERKAILADTNSELINAYRVVRGNVEELIALLKTYVNTEEFFYAMRAKNSGLNEVEQAARTIYLNKTCFNGLYRVNRKGEFNASFGFYKNVWHCEEDNLRQCSEALRNATILNLGYQSTVENCMETNDFVYLDPPYIPLTKTANFKRYNINQFSDEDHKKLADTYRWIYSNGGTALISNSNADLTREIYSSFKFTEVNARRNINSDGQKRGIIKELLVTGVR